MSNSRKASRAAAPRVLLALTVTGQPGTDGQVAMTSEYDRPTTVAMLHRIADKFAAEGQPTIREEPTT